MMFLTAKKKSHEMEKAGLQIKMLTYQTPKSFKKLNKVFKDTQNTLHPLSGAPNLPILPWKVFKNEKGSDWKYFLSNNSGHFEPNCFPKQGLCGSRGCLQEGCGMGGEEGFGVCGD